VNDETRLSQPNLGGKNNIKLQMNYLEDLAMSTTFSCLPPDVVRSVLHTHTRTHTLTHTRAHTHTLTHTYTHIASITHTHTHTPHIHTHTHTYTHTRTHHPPYAARNPIHSSGQAFPAGFLPLLPPSTLAPPVHDQITKHRVHLGSDADPWHPRVSEKK